MTAPGADALGANAASVPIDGSMTLGAGCAATGAAWVAGATWATGAAFVAGAVRRAAFVAGAAAFFAGAAADFFAGAAAFFAGAAADFFAGAAIVVALADLRAAGFFGGVGIGRSSEHQVNGENTDRPRMASFGGGVHGSSRN